MEQFNELKDCAAAIEMAVNSLLHYLAVCGIQERELKRKWIEDVAAQATSRACSVN